MEKWKKIRNITLSIFIISLLPILWWLFEAIWHDINGYTYIVPGPGFTRWYNIFIFKSFWYLIIWGIPAIVDVILFIISMIKIKENNLAGK